MALGRQLLATIRANVRYRLLALVLFPILLVMPIALWLTASWGQQFTYDQLFLKVHTDLSVAHDVFRRLREDYLAELERLSGSYTFYTALEAENELSINQQIDALRDRARFSYLHLINTGGQRLYRNDSDERRVKSSPLLLRAAQGRPASGVELFSAEELLNESEALAGQAFHKLLATERARPTLRQVENRGMMLRVVQPVFNSRRQIIALLDGGVLLNRNFEFVDRIRDLVYGPGSLPQGSIGTVTVFLDDVRITTNVPLRPGERALGTRVSDEVRTQVLDLGETWINRAFVVNDWYISSYEPILDVSGDRIGMLYAGFLEKPFRSSLFNALWLLVAIPLVLMAMTAAVSILGAKSIFRPLERMTEVVRATRAGEGRRIGFVDASDEIGELAREFDSMLDLLEERNRQLREWGDQLEHKVANRTIELERKNADLRRTIRVLRDTRQQLVMAEKLAAIGELTAGVAHEINNPAAVMLGNLDLIRVELGDAAKPVQQEIELVIAQIYRIREIVDNLLKYARPDQFAGYLEVIDVNQLIKETLRLVQHLRRGKEFQIELDLTAETTIQINRNELQQVLVNLMVNAIHALADSGGVVNVISREWARGGVEISIHDNGCGMDEQQLDHIFNPFFTTKQQGEGTGLGLSVSYGLIRRYGGTIKVQSQLGVGTEFRVFLLAEPELIEDEETIAEQLRDLESEAVGHQ